MDGTGPAELVQQHVGAKRATALYVVVGDELSAGAAGSALAARYGDILQGRTGSRTTRDPDAAGLA